MRARGPILVAAAVAVSSCASLNAPGGSACAVGEAMIETQLYFGQTIPGGGSIKAAAWSAFVQSEVVPRFPEGFTVVDGKGFWLDGATKKTITEPSKVIIRLHPPGDEPDRAIDVIAEAYKKKFSQESVLRVDRPTCARF